MGEPACGLFVLSVTSGRSHAIHAIDWKAKETDPSLWGKTVGMCWVLRAFEIHAHDSPQEQSQQLHAGSADCRSGVGKAIPSTAQGASSTARMKAIGLWTTLVTRPPSGVKQPNIILAPILRLPMTKA